MKFELNLNLDVGTTLRKYRNMNGYSQQSVSDHLNISRQAYRKWEDNTIDFSISQLEKIADLYALPLHIIILESYFHKNP